MVDQDTEGNQGMVDQETEGNQEWSIKRQREIKNGRSRDRWQTGMVDQETEGNHLFYILKLYSRLYPEVLLSSIS
jgi:hypothetical protein